MTPRLLSAALSLGFLWAAPAAEITVAPAATAGMSPERLARLDPWLEQMVADGKAAGFVTLVARRGHIVHHRATGSRGMDAPEPMPLDALFDIASMTKPITAVAALTLLEEGRITLDEAVSDYLPEFADRLVQGDPGWKEPATRVMTVRHLFTHTSGVSDGRTRAEKYEFPTMGAYMAELAQLPLGAQPGSRWIYGDSLDVLGHLVERVSGQTLDSFVRERVLEPLGMADTHYWPPEAKQDRRALLVVNGQDDPERLSREPAEAGRLKSFVSGASGLHSTAGDYWRFCQMLANGGILAGQRILGPRTVTLMAEDHLGEGVQFRPGQGFGLGVAVIKDRGRATFPYSVGSYYWGGSQGTLFWVDPAEQLIGVLMVQARPRPGLQLRERFATMVYSAIVD